MNAQQQPFKYVLWLLGLVTAVFLPAYLLVTFFWPGIVPWVIYLNIATLIGGPAGYWLIKRFVAQLARRPYFVFEFDVILPVVPFFMIAFALIAPLPQFATFVWGQTTTGNVLDLQTTPTFDFQRSYQVTTTYVTETGGQFTKEMHIGRRLFNTLAVDDGITLHYLPRFPQRAIIADPFLMQTQARMLLWSQFVLTGWLVGAFVCERRRAQVASAETAPLSPLQFYNLDRWLTEEDDANLWQALLENHFPSRHEETIHVSGLRWGVGEAMPEARYKLQPFDAVGFVRDENGRILPTPCPIESQTDADDDPALAPIIPCRVVSIQKLPRENRPYFSVIVARPSANRERVWVYTAVYRKNGRGTGKTSTWQRQPDGTWQDTDERHNGWYEG